MTLSLVELQRLASETGFQVDPLEKVLRLLELLDTLRIHPFLKDRVVLKGGTALNLFVFDVPRLSVDVDLNYVGAVDREGMLAERPQVEQAVQAVCGRLGIGVRRVPSEHAGGKWRLSYGSVTGRTGTLELDMNFMLRTPLWPPLRVDSRQVGRFAARQVPVVDVHELAAGKLAAIFGRNAGRDLFDAHGLLTRGGLDMGRLRLGFVVYGGGSRRDWRTVTVEDVVAEPEEVERQLVPMLRADLAPKKAEVGVWCRRLVDECRSRLAALLPLTESEVVFLDALNDRGEILPELLTEDVGVQAVLKKNPGLLWKAQNVRQHRRD